MAVTMATLMGLSPEGQELLTADYLRRTTVDRHARSTQLYRAIGEELSRENPDRAVLSALAEEQAAEAARLDLQDSTQLFDLAFDLSSTDRQKMGQFMVKTAGEDRRAPAGR
ncbi:hypothetical protein PK98_11565 [Croceibacterium mercuriale]|uniref:Uncharacterized protein n=2 Tax=Croceibacterium mercuriale TaxID=1572751 RepID=A0A0B2BY45_9SPHN|nr:hypothetical protein PK98_11565 [Croceibacterium mercuriale]